MSKDFELGDLVWAKMKGFPPWPAKITQAPESTPAKSKKPQHFVFFFGTHDVAWILDELIYPHSAEMLANSNNYKKKSSTLQSAIEEIKQESQNQPEKVVKDMSILEEIKEIEKSASIPGPSKTPKKATPKKKIEKKPKKRPEEALKEKKPKKRPSAEMDDYLKPGPSKSKEEPVDQYDFEAQLIANVPPNNASNHEIPFPLDDKIDLDDLREINKLNPSTVTSHKKFGFLGLGVMGSMMVKNLLKSGHNVTVWNRTLKKCDAFRDMGAKVGDNPADVIRLCDITFCCVEDSEAVKDVVYGRYGVIVGLQSGSGSKDSKGYVEMTSVDPTTAKEVSESVTGAGGRYLEAPMVGTRQSCEKAALLVLGAGDRALYAECDSCFAAFGDYTYYLGTIAGSSAKMNILASMAYATTLAALAESLALSEKCGVNPVKFMNASVDSQLNCELLMKNGRDMIKQKKKVHRPIKHFQNELDMAVRLSNDFDQPLRVTMAVNESFKRARHLKLGENVDISAIYQTYKF